MTYFRHSCTLPIDVFHGTSPESEKNKTEIRTSHSVKNKSSPEPLWANKFGKVEQVTRAATIKVPRTTKSLDVTYTRQFLKFWPLLASQQDFHLYFRLLTW